VDGTNEAPVARAWGGGAVVAALTVVSVAYFGFVFAEAYKAGSAAKRLPAPIAYFTQIASLFPRSARHVIDYRVEAFRCKDKAWEEIDPSPWFPIDADNKENRFYRTMHFFGEHQHRETLRALEDFIWGHYESDRIAAAARGDGRPPIGGVRFVRVQSDIGAPGDVEARFAKKPLPSFGPDDRRDLYYTPESRREARCKQLGAW
jgi:hypothetical protein